MARAVGDKAPLLRRTNGAVTMNRVPQVSDCCPGEDVRGEDGHNGMKSQLRTLCDRFDQFEKKAIR